MLRGIEPISVLKAVKTRIKGTTPAQELGESPEVLKILFTELYRALILPYTEELS